MTSKPIIVFVPGAWHSPDSVQLSRDALHERGWETVVVTLPSVGAEPPSLGIPEDAAAIRSVIEPIAEQGKQIVLVTHSYGSVAGGSAVRGLGYEHRRKDGKSGGVITFLYVTAFVTMSGTSLMDGMGGDWYPWMRPEGDYVYVREPAELFYHDLSPEAQKKAVAALKHQSKRAVTDKADHEPWHDILCLYFVCEDDRALPAFAQEAMASVLGPDSIVYRSKCSHSPFLSAVEDVVAGVEKAVRAGQAKVAEGEVL